MDSISEIRFYVFAKLPLSTVASVTDALSLHHGNISVQK